MKSDYEQGYDTACAKFVNERNALLKRAEVAEKERDSLLIENKLAGMEWMERYDLLKARAEALGEIEHLKNVRDAMLKRAKAAEARAEAAEAKVRELEAASRWIPVTERLPENLQNVLFLADSGDVYMGTHMKSIRQWAGYGLYWHDDNYSSITHWQPLPHPPKQEKLEI